MIGFIIGVQTWVDITMHQIGAETIGRLFDRFPDAAIADQRLLWMFPLAYLAVKGAGAVSVDALLRRRFALPRLAPRSVTPPRDAPAGGPPSGAP